MDAVEQFVKERDRRLAAAEAIAERYRALAQLSPEAILVQKGGRIDFANPAAARLFGAASDLGLIGRSPSELFEPAGYEEFCNQIERLLTGEAIVPVAELKLIRPNGSQKVVEAVASRLEQETGAAVEIVARDITERKRAEQFLKESDPRYAQPEDVQCAKEAGFNAHIPKPPDLDRLTDLLVQAARETAALVGR